MNVGSITKVVESVAIQADTTSAQPFGPLLACVEEISKKTKAITRLKRKRKYFRSCENIADRSDGICAVRFSFDQRVADV